VFAAFYYRPLEGMSDVMKCADTITRGNLVGASRAGIALHQRTARMYRIFPIFGAVGDFLTD
jgi:hypothetical protein